MPDTVLNFTNGFYEFESLPASNQNCLNAFPSTLETAGLSQDVLLATPGINELARTSSLSTQNNRGSGKLGDNAYFVNGNSLFRFNEDNSLDFLGDITGFGRVSIKSNGIQLMILVPGGDGYIFTENPDTLTLITDPGFTANGNPQILEFIDSFFIVSTDTKRFIKSAVNDGFSWNALDFGSAESDPDPITSLIKHKNRLFVAGSQTIDQFRTVPTEDFPFQRTGLFLDKGVFAPFSIVNINETFMFVGGDKNESPSIWQFQANQVQKISTKPIDLVLDSLADEELNEVFALTYSERGQFFVGFFLPDTAFFYDLSEGKWHERNSKVVNPDGTVEIKRFRINSILNAYGKILVGDSEDGRIGQMDKEILEEYGEEIIRQWTTQPFQNNQNTFSVPEIEITMESGTGNEQRENPKIGLSLSRDGRKFGDMRTRLIGKRGQSRARQKWYRNGRFDRFSLLRFTFTGKAKFAALQLTANIQGGFK